MSHIGETCLKCGTGHYLQVARPYAATDADQQPVTVPSLLQLECDRCGDVVVPIESHRYVDTYLALPRL